MSEVLRTGMLPVPSARVRKERDQQTEFIFRETSCSKGTPSSFLPERWWAGGPGRTIGLFHSSLVSSAFS